MAAILLTSIQAVAQDLKPVVERLSDQAIVADTQTYKSWQARIKGLNDKGVRVGDYHLSKAQCWLDVSLHEYTRNDRSAFPQLALQQGALIVQALESGTSTNPGQQTPLLNEADLLRADLWARFAKMKSAPGFSCAAQKIACAEVELVHAGNEHKQLGWRHANPYIQMAEDLLQQAEAAAAECNAPSAVALCAPAPVAACAPVMPATLPVSMPKVTTNAEHISLAADALFAFDKSALADLLPEGRAKIDEMMRKLDQAYARIERIKLTGFTDRLGGIAYNQALSELRSATVRDYIKSQGYGGEILTDGKGKSGQLLACEGVQPLAKLRNCLQPNRRVEIEVIGVKR
ncbi:OmpA family protein [Undibacterium sp.]|uniref:OmpA family protein n=1 Tax=Undibacterium sp. TaxID=1914977 RepID=UPI0025D87308|nr:OmpA family protein [Undibacterium sp.]